MRLHSPLIILRRSRAYSSCSEKKSKISYQPEFLLAMKEIDRIFQMTNAALFGGEEAKTDKALLDEKLGDISEMYY